MKRETLLIVTVTKLILCFLAIPILSYGQAKVNFNEGSIAQSRFCDTIPFEFIKDKMIVKVKINHKTKRFIVDTGNTLAISDELQTEMNNEVLDSVFQMDAVGSRKKRITVKVGAFELGNLTFKNIPAVVMNVKETGFLTCFNYDGFIGSNALRNCIVHFDLKHQYLILTNDITNLNVKNAYAASIRLDKQSGPHIEVKIGNKMEFDALFDSGSDEFMAISNDTYSKIKKKNLAQLLNEGFGAATIAMHGSESEKSKQRVSIHSVNFGQYSIQNFISIISTGYVENALGIGLAKYGTITIDYLHNLFYFSPTQPIQAFENGTTLGFIPYPEKTYFKVGIVWTNTQAQQAGLKSGYRILKINDLDLTTRTPETDCELFLTQPFKQPTMTLTYMDEKNEIKKITLKQE